MQPLQKTQHQPPVGPSVDSLCHPWFTTTNLSYRLPIFETSATALCGAAGIYVWVHVGCLPQTHKQCCQQQDRSMNTKVCNANTCTLCVCTTFHGSASHTCVQHHCMVVSVYLHVYACVCMILCVWLYDNVGMMSWWRTQDHLQLVTACHPTWLRLYQFMWGEIVGKVPEGSNADTLLGSGGFRCSCGGFRCRYLVSFWKFPVQIPVEVPGPASFTIVQHHCMLVCVWLYLSDCVCMIVWQCAHYVIVKIIWIVELVTRA